MKKSLFTLISIILISITTNVSHAGNSLRIPDEFMMQIKPENFTRNLGTQNRNDDYHSIDANNTCLATTTNGRRFIYKTCDTTDITQRFRYKNNQLVNAFDDCLTQLIEPQSTNSDFCDSERGRVISETTNYQWNINFNSCNRSASQTWNIEASNTGNIIITHENNCLAFTGERITTQVGCNIMLCDDNDSDNCIFIAGDRGQSSLEIFRTQTESCSTNLTYDLNNPEGGSLIIERLIPIVIPL